ncbi:response regulator [Ramlibacter sp. G-1-2-2]|uniref:histidine kinase n=1 Tax=Ramlibacter agri TaxID=2728837 RepID=A0A848HDQ7_9BURK|nr:chemotaxis protein CheB [Ramlibacter agri]NML47491.1 response regulator [Ramlibacter agri]
MDRPSHLPSIETGDFDVVALVGSAGAGPAGLQVLRDLPPGFSVPLIAAFHLAPDSVLDQVFARAPFEVVWARQGSLLAAGRLLLCPPRQFLDILPDGSCQLSPCEGGALEKPLDRFLGSVAQSFASRAIGVVLTGMGNDGAAGALELHRAGGQVVVQSEASAEYPAMPASAIAAGSASIVIPLGELGHLVGELLTRTPRREMRSEVEAVRRVFGDHGEMAARAREVDWSRTPLGPAVDWPEALRIPARTIMDASNPQALWWGPQLTQVYNDAWRVFLGVRKHPQALGGPAAASWPEVWHDIGPMVARVMATGVAEAGKGYLLLVQRDEYVEEVFADFSYAPVRDAAGAVLGVHHNVWETTHYVVAERRLQALRTLGAQLAAAQGMRDACERAATALGSDPQDLPFALFYLLDAQRRQGVLAAAAGVAPGAACAPHLLPLDVGTPWPLLAVLGSVPDAQVLLSDLANRCAGLPPVPLAREGALPPQSALLRPLRASADEPPVGVMVLGLSPHRQFDEGYRAFLDLVAVQLAAGIGQGRATELERERRERLAALDREKMLFFADVSHEFRTPLTLLLAPLEELLRRQDSLPASLAADVDVAVRNARRLLALVTNLLDFSQAESRRKPARLAPLDLRTLTAEVVSHFRSAIGAAGLQLRMEFDEQLLEVPVDPEMWTTVVSNLVSNALKFTFEGEIAVKLRALKLHAELVVSDTGIGIAESELGNVFKRFHRVRGARARTSEGAGIGLSMVQDLVQRMGGQVRVRSRSGCGSEFMVWLPYKSYRMQAGAEPDPVPRAASDLAADLADQAARWVEDDAPAGVLHDLVAQSGGRSAAPAVEPVGAIVVVDDNADMRRYLQRLLGGRWVVETASDGETGLAAIHRLRPQAVLADVMMGGIDGFELLRRVRADRELRHTPVVLVTARAGEAAAIESLLAGADDYIAKPFSPRELLARVQAVVDRARVDAALRASELRFRTLFETMRQGYSECEIVRDDQGRAVSYRVLDANPAWERLTGLPAAACRGRDVLDFLPGIERSWIDTADRVVRLNRREHIEHEAAALGAWFETDFYPSGGDRFNALYEDITERKLAEMRQAFLLRLSDALRPLRDPIAIQQAAMQVLGTHMKVNRAFYGDAQDDGDTLAIGPGFSKGTFPLEGHVKFSDFDADMAAWYLAGQTVVIHDVRDHPLVSAKARPNFDAIQVGAAVGVPLVKEGRVRAIVSLHQTAPRQWTDAEVSLLEETAERTWAAVERAKAEAVLQASEARQGFLLGLSTSAERTRRQNEALQAVVRGAPMQESLAILARMVAEETQGEARTAFYMADAAGAQLHPVRGAGDMPEAELDPAGDRGCWSFPIQTRERLAIGTFAMYFRTPREPAAADRELAELVTRTAAIVMASHRADAKYRALLEATAEADRPPAGS